MPYSSSSACVDVADSSMDCGDESRVLSSSSLVESCGTSQIGISVGRDTGYRSVSVCHMVYV